MMTTSEELLATLNEEQRQAVEDLTHDSLVIAGAGSGKTRVLTTKIAYILAEGKAGPSEVLALTFTNKAAREMRSRIATIVGEDLSRMIPMGTFHSIFARWLRGYGKYLGYDSDYTIYDSGDSRTLVKVIIRDMKLDEKDYPPKKVYGLISACKNDGLTPGSLSDSDPRLRRMPRFEDVYKGYLSRCFRANAMDFDDLLINMLRLLRQHPEVRDELHRRFRYILVDEYQDTNWVQNEIVKQLKGPDTILTVVGDDAQSIYSFRGAVIENILSFSNTFPGAVVYKLRKNYRSTSNIVDIANSLIEKNHFRIPKTVEAIAGQGEKLTLFDAFSGKTEAERVAEMISSSLRRGRAPEEVAILYRTNAQSRLFEEQLRNYSIPYRIYGGLSFYDRAEIKDALAYLRLVINASDDEAFRRVYNTPKRGIGDVTFSTLSDLANSQRKPLMEVAADPDLMAETLKAGPVKRISDFVELINQLREAANTGMTLAEYMSHLILATRLPDMYSDDSVESLSKLDNLNELVSAVQEYEDAHYELSDDPVTIEDFVRDMSLYTDADQKEDGTPRVTLMTMHASKGLEYEEVYCVGLEDQLIPSDRYSEEKDIEEERRLLYVAITRAKERCILSYAQSRMTHGQLDYQRPSRFLLDLDPRYLKDHTGLTDYLPRSSARVESPREVRPSVMPSSPEKSSPHIDPRPRRVRRVIRTKEEDNEPLTDRVSEADLCKGDRVEHPTFGVGQVEGFSQSVSGTKVLVTFDDGSRKQMILKFAKLRKI